MDNPIPPTVGRIVYFVLPASSKRAGEIRPATVVRVNMPGHDGESCNLAVHLDGPNDVGEDAWRMSVVYQQPTEGQAYTPGTWHWMPYQLTAAKTQASA